MRARWFLLTGLGIGAVIGVVRVLTTPRAAPVSDPVVVEGTRLFESVFSHVRSFAVDSLDTQELYRRAAAGVIDELDDPYAVLIPEGQTPPSLDSAAPQGLYLERRDGGAVVVATVAGSPAAAAGIREGDQVLAVDSTVVDPSRMDRVWRGLAGPNGTPVILRVRHPGIRAVATVTLTRGPVPGVPTVRAEVLSDRIGHLRIGRMVSGIADTVRHAVDTLRTRGVRGMVLDLRGTVGGELADGVALADLFLGPATTLAVSRGRPGAASATFTDSSSSPFDSLSLAVLVDEGTAGAAEVVAGALQDHDRAAVFGATTFGRGVTQSTFSLGEGASLRLTTALWMTPSGRQIQRPPRTRADSTPAPTVKSDAGRPLQGGGGIVPDRIVRDSGATDLVLAAAHRLLQRAGSARAVVGLLGTGN